MIVLSLLVQSCFCWGVACSKMCPGNVHRSVQGASPKDLLARCTFLAQCGPSQSTGRQDTAGYGGLFLLPGATVRSLYSHNTVTRCDVSFSLVSHIDLRLKNQSKPGFNSCLFMRWYPVIHGYQRAPSQQKRVGIGKIVIKYTIWLFNIAMENHHF